MSSACSGSPGPLEKKTPSGLSSSICSKVVVDGTYDADNDSYINFNEQVMIDATDASLIEEDVDKLKKRVKAHIEKGCTVMHTYEQETPVRMDIEVRR